MVIGISQKRFLNLLWQLEVLIIFFLGSRVLMKITAPKLTWFC